MSLEPWPEVGVEPMLDYKVFHVRKARRISPRTGVTRGFFVLDVPAWINVVAFTERRELVMVRQYRHGTEEFTLEIPGGLVDPGEAPIDAARRELREESAHIAAHVEEIGRCAPNPAFQTNWLTTFLATGCRREGELLQDPGEDIEVVLVPEDEVEQRIVDGTIDHALVLVGLYFAKLRGT